MIKRWWQAFKGADNDRMGFFANQGTARFTSTFVWIARVSFLALLVTLMFLGILFYWSIKDYDLFIVREFGPIQTSEYTEDGIPIIREGDFVTYNVHFKNSGVNTLAEREAIIYGSLETGPQDTPIAAFELANVRFFVSEPIEAESVVEIGLPANLPRNSYYRIKTTTNYEPNPIRTIGVASDTETFLYLEEDFQLP